LAVKRIERIRWLKAQVDELAAEIESVGRSAEVAEFALAVRSDPASLEPVREDEWRVLLPEERAALLPAYYMTLRLELTELDRGIGRERAGGRLDRWLNGRAPKVVDFAASAAALGELVHTGLHAAGVLAHEGSLPPGEAQPPASGLSTGLDGPA
jgi:hypothetical protein